MGHVLGLGYTSLSFLFSSLHSHLSGSHVNERPPSPQSHREQTMIPHLLPRPSPSRFHRIGSIRLVRSVQDPAQGQELLLRHVPLLQRRHEDVHPPRRSSAARLLSFDQALLRHGIKLFRRRILHHRAPDPGEKARMEKWWDGSGPCSSATHGRLVKTEKDTRLDLSQKAKKGMIYSAA
uniref:Uncharacterized protein n=1 Tax=Brassica oleracea TaxID=3712 RepID=A0A3P6EJH3_BRAOL|nr:unnamed protein product [Brassica oleracea]